MLTPTRLDVEGWTMRQVAPGFRQVSCVSRQMDDAGDAAGEPAARSRCSRAIYADGLTYVSVFIEPFSPKRHAQPMLAVGRRDADAVDAPGRLVGHGRRRCAGRDAQDCSRTALERRK